MIACDEIQLYPTLSIAVKRESGSARSKCGRRHGARARADMEEALGEVTKYMGLFGEMQFCLSVAKRSVSDILQLLELENG